MPKYYVTDNNKQLTIARPNKAEAAKAFVRHFDARGILLQPYISVSERGFEDNQITSDAVFSTDELLSAA